MRSLRFCYIRWGSSFLSTGSHENEKKLQNLQMLQSVSQEDPKLKQQCKCFQGKWEMSTWSNVNVWSPTFNSLSVAITQTYLETLLTFSLSTTLTSWSKENWISSGLPMEKDLVPSQRQQPNCASSAEKRQEKKIKQPSGCRLYKVTKKSTAS